MMRVVNHGEGMDNSVKMCEVTGSTTGLQLTDDYQQELENACVYLTTGDEDKEIHPMMGMDETFDEYIAKHMIEKDDPSIVINLMEHDLYLELHDSESETEESECESDEGTEDEQSPKSHDGNEDGNDKDEKPDGSGGYSSKQSTDVAMYSTDNLSDIPNVDFTNEHFLIDQAKTKEDYIRLEKRAMNICRFYFDIAKDMKERVKKLDKEEKKKAKEEQKKRDAEQKKQDNADKKTQTINLTIRAGAERPPLSINIEKGATLLDLKERIGQEMRMSKKKSKDIELTIHDKTYPKASNRKTIASCFQDGDSALMVARGSGGAGKRTRSTSQNVKEGNEKDISEMIGMHLMRCQSKPNLSPIITTAVNNVAQAMQKIETGNVSLDEIFENLSVSDMKKLLLVPTLSTKPEARSKAIANVIFKPTMESLSELATQTDLMQKTIPLLVHYLMTKKFSSGEGSSFSWTSFLSVVSEIIEARATPSKGAGKGDS